MRLAKLSAGIARLDELEGKLCLPCNQIAQLRPVRHYFRTVSRLGDGMFWYALLVALPVFYGRAAILPTLHMAATAIAGVIVYKGIKGSLMRERPFASHAAVVAVAQPLDRYSFPSGHTLHATAFFVMLAQYFPEIAVLVLPFSLSVAASRVVLGLHYPSDVLVGGLMGWGLAHISLAVVPF